MRSRPIFLFFLAIALSSCSFWGRPAPSETVLRADPIVEEGRVLNKGRLRQGGKLLIVPFNPGVEAAAGEASDRVALMIVKGISEELAASSSPLEVLMAENSDDVELVLRGHVDNLREPSGVKKHFPFSGRKSLSVDGKIEDAGTGEVLLYFRHTRQARDRGQDFSELAMDIGRDIARFMISSSAAERTQQ